MFILKSYDQKEDKFRIFQIAWADVNNRKGSRVGRLTANNKPTNGFLIHVALPPFSIETSHRSILRPGRFIGTEADSALAYEGMSVESSLRPYTAIATSTTLDVTLRASLGISITPAMYCQFSWPIFGKQKYSPEISNHFVKEFGQLYEKALRLEQLAGVYEKKPIEIEEKKKEKDVKEVEPSTGNPDSHEPSSSSNCPPGTSVKKLKQGTSSITDNNMAKFSLKTTLGKDKDVNFEHDNSLYSSLQYRVKQSGSDGSNSKSAAKAPATQTSQKDVLEKLKPPRDDSARKAGGHL